MAALKKLQTPIEERLTAEIQKLPTHYKEFKDNEFSSDYFKSRIETLVDEPEFENLENGTKDDEFKLVFRRFENRKKTLLALFYSVIDEEEKAMEILEEIISSDANASIVAMVNLAWLKIETGDPSEQTEAEDLINKAKEIYTNKDAILFKLIADAEICHFHERVGPDHYLKAIEGFRDIVKTAETICPAAAPYDIIWRYELADLINRTFNKNVLSGPMKQLKQSNVGPEDYLQEAAAFLKPVVESSSEFGFMRARGWVMYVYLFNQYRYIKPIEDRTMQLEDITPNGENLCQCLKMVVEFGINDYYSMERLGRFYRTVEIDLDEAEKYLKEAAELRPTPYCYNQIALAIRDKLNKEEAVPELEVTDRKNGEPVDEQKLCEKMRDLMTDSPTTRVPETLDVTRQPQPETSGEVLSPTTPGIKPSLKRTSSTVKHSVRAKYFQILRYSSWQVERVREIVENFRKATKMTQGTSPYFQCEYFRWQISLALTEGTTLMSQKKLFRELKKMTNQSKDMMPRNAAYIYETLGQFMKFKDNKEEAKFWYREAISTRMSYRESPGLSFVDLRQLINNDTEQSKKNKNLADLFEIVGDYPGAIGFLQEELLRDDLEPTDETALLLSMAKNYANMGAFSEAELLFHIYMQRFRDEKTIPADVRSLYLDIRFGVMKHIAQLCRQDTEPTENDTEELPEPSYFYRQILQDVLLRAPSARRRAYDFYIVVPEELADENSELEKRAYELYETIVSFGIPSNRCCFPRKTLTIPGSQHAKQDAYVYIIPMAFVKIEVAWRLAIDMIKTHIQENDDYRSILLVRYEDECPLDVAPVDRPDEVADIYTFLKSCPVVFEWHKHDQQELNENFIRAIIDTKYWTKPDK
ncbi:uncharacterized protein LOC141908641 [Tubulanus polymorphus]|uniref:uncharacterized protein LOC141908641 n=1 Tax=Tubulanus polymorphus TaxID=672921 RepID=UPI003DA591B8